MEREQVCRCVPQSRPMMQQYADSHEGTAPAGSLRAVREESQRQLQDLDLQKRNAFEEFKRFKGAKRLREAAEKEIELEELQQKLAGQLWSVVLPCIPQ